jgi:hypothetical protein
LPIITVHGLEYASKIAVTNIGGAWVTVITSHGLWLTDILYARVDSTSVIIFAFVIAAGWTRNDTRDNRRVRTADVHVTKILRTWHFVITYRCDIDTRVRAAEGRIATVFSTRITIIALNQVVITYAHASDVLTRISGTRVIVRTVCGLEYTANLSITGIDRTTVIIFASNDCVCAR